MAQFLGSVQGQRGEVTRLGTKSSGIITEAAGWGGKIKVQIDYDEVKKEDTFLITQETHQGAGICEVIASGVLGKPAKRVKEK